MPVIMGFTYSTFDPASRFRFIQYRPHFKKAGWRALVRPNIPPRPFPRPFHKQPWKSRYKLALRWLREIARRRDIRDAASVNVVFVNRDTLDWDIGWEQALLRSNPRVIYDFDDAIYFGEQGPQVQWMCENARWVTAGNEYLANHARRFTDRVTVLPTAVDTDRYLVRDYEEPTAGPIRVGWLGSDLSIKMTLFPHWETLGRLQRTLGFEFVIVSRPRPCPPSADLRWRWIPWSPRVEERISEQMDIGLMPLVDEPFQRHKCATKILQYMAGGLPFIATPLGVNAQIIAASAAGFAARSENEWAETIGALIRDPALRHQMGHRGRHHCEAEYSVRRWFPVLLEIVERLRAAA
ncbi:MAG TPA: glycosyltransferase [Verrucomicrobiae bacterium]|nr:glycosyltransferase [Verrucomicrobiae bacterium]